ncbi:hypothetical protein niasHT_001373 [Heterodera trifolii]|uniref:Uncharacterized protein n=1 Tax=Heterodera trifolii TaxID=157864 RepID=A0ABD2LN04_9BILA
MNKHQQHRIENPSKMNEFQILKEILKAIKDSENYEKMENYGQKFSCILLYKQKIAALKELLAILDQIIGHYSGTDESYQMEKRRRILLDASSKGKKIFSKILFETLSKYSQNVNYDEKRQLLSFPLSTGEHIIARLSELIELIDQQRRAITYDGISRQIDVVKTIQNIASMEPIQFYERKFTLYSHECIIFDFFFSMAIRLSAQIERNDHLNALLSASLDYDYNHFFDFKIQITNDNLVEINTPTWRVPYYVYWGNNKDTMVSIYDHVESKKPLDEALVQREALRNFMFLFSLSKHSPTFDELMEMANFFDRIKNYERISDIPPKLKILGIVMKFLKKPYGFNFDPKVPVQNLQCILAHFVEEFLKKAMAEKPKLPFSVIHQSLAKKRVKMCGHKRKGKRKGKERGKGVKGGQKRKGKERGKGVKGGQKRKGKERGKGVKGGQKRKGKERGKGVKGGQKRKGKERGKGVKGGQKRKGKEKERGGKGGKQEKGEGMKKKKEDIKEKLTNESREK